MLDKYSDVMTVTELSSALRIGRNSAYKLAASGKLRVIKNGRHYLIPKQSVIKYIAEAADEL